MTQATELRELATLLDVSSNNVGIGLPSGTPSNNLVISDGVRTSAAITAGTTALEIARTSGGDVGILINKDTSKWLIGIDNSDGNAGPLRFMYGAYNAAAHPGFGSDYSGLNLAYDGKIGIGTKTPGYELHVKGAGDIKIEDSAGGSAHLRLGASTSGLRNSEWKVKVSGSNDEFYIDHDYTGNNGSSDVAVTGVGSAFKINSTQSLYNDNRQPTVRPTLNLDFANSKELDSRITFYRDSIATYYDSKGVLKYANVNEPRFDHDPATGESKGLLIEEDRSFLSTNTITVNGGYWGFSNATASVKQAVAPDGTYSADGIHANTVNDGHGLFKAFTPTANTYYTLTAYFKRGANRYASIAWYYNEAAGNYPTAFFDLDNGTLAHTAGINRGTTMTDVGNGWYRCSVTVLTDATPSTSYFYATSATASGTAAYVGTGAVDTYFWGLQIEIGPFPTSFIPSDTSFTSRASTATYHDETGILRTAPVDGERYGYKYDGRKWVETGLILESAGTNLLQNSQSMSSTGWATTHGFVTPDVATAPDGSMTAEKLVANTTNSIHYVRQYISKSSGTAVAYTLSCYIKSAEKNIAWMSTYSSTNEEYVGKFDLSTGVATTSASGTTVDMHYVGNDWYRCELSCTVGSTPSNASLTVFVGDSSQTSYVSSWAGNNSDGIYVWGAQMETSGGKSATSYIQTYGSTGTRSADVASSVAYTRTKDIAKINNILNEDWYNTKEGSIYVDFDPTSGSGSDTVVVGIGDGTIRGFRAPWLTGDTQIRAASWSGTAYSALHYYNSVTTTDQHKLGISFSYQDATFTSSLDGSTAQQATSWAGVETDATTMWIGGETDTGRPYTGTIGKVSIYNESLSGAELQALTENN